MPFDKARASAYLGFGLASIADYQRRGELDKAELMTLLMLVALEQACLDNGRWSLAWLVAHQPEPPGTAFVTRLRATRCARSLA